MDQVQTGKKVGPDGLTKKERRALKIGATGVNSSMKRDGKEVNHCNKNKIETESAIKNSTPSNKIQIVLTTNIESMPDKAKLKSERRALQEAQKLAKANAKNSDCVVVKELPTNELINKENNNELSKAELRAQRRAAQETQRQAKANLIDVKTKVLDKSEQKKPHIKKTSPKKVLKESHKHHVSLFDHLNNNSCNLTKELKSTYVHAAFLKLGSQYSSKTILGSNARCLALLSALKCLISDFTTPPKEELCRSLESAIESAASYLRQCRTLAVTMTNALKHLKLYLTQINTNLSDNEKKSELIIHIDTYISNEIYKAGAAITARVTEKICNGDVILTFGCSSLIQTILLQAHKDGKNFKVIVVDARPLLEGREMLRVLVSTGIRCTYVLINAVSFIMNRVTKVLLGAHALLANGYVMSRTGTAQVALIANAYNKPVLVCCETYKFCERVQTDSFVYNELDDPNKLVKIDTLEGSSPLVNWQNSIYLTPLNLMYDVTPPDFVTAVVTELAFLPCTSVPVILRIRPTEMIK